MNPQVIKATDDDFELCYKLFQYYIYNLSECTDVDLEEMVRFKDYRLKDYWIKENHFPYLVEVNGISIGFALVKWVKTNTKSYYSMDEFFIMKEYQRAGIGKSVAKQIFRLHRGQWEVSQMKKNEPAQLFWRTVIDEYIDGQFTEWEEKTRITQAFLS